MTRRGNSSARAGGPQEQAGCARDRLADLPVKGSGVPSERADAEARTLEPGFVSGQTAGSGEVAHGPGWTLYRSAWEAALADKQCDALICDPPYSARTHAAATTRNDGSDAAGLTPDYDPWSPADVMAFVQSWSPRTRGWMVCLCDHGLIDAYEAAYDAVGRYAFPPLPVIIRGMSHRMQADGPSSENVWAMAACGCDWSGVAMVARPKSKEFVDRKWNSRGFYKSRCGCETPDHLDGNSTRNGRAGGSASGKGRGKPPWLEHALVRAFSSNGDVVCDPLAGFGGTLAAAVALGRSAIGAEMDAAAFAEARRRLARPLQVDLFASGEVG